MNTIYLYLKLPPPHHGSTYMNLMIYESAHIEAHLNIIKQGVSISEDTNDIGKISIGKIRKIIADYRRLKKNIKEVKPELLYFTLSPIGPAFIKDYFFARIIRRKKIPIVFHMHGKGIKKQSENFVYKYLYKKTFRQQRAICLSPQLISDISDFPFKKILIVPNGIPDIVKHQTAYIKKEAIPTFLFLSNFIKTKGVEEFLRACGILKKKNIRFRIELIGKPIDISVDQITELAKEIGIYENISSIGPAYNEFKFEKIRSANALVFPTYYKNECVPLVLLEAMQCGIPVITSKEGGIPSVIKDGHNGLLIDPQSTYEIADAMERIISDKMLAQNISINARKDFEQFYTKEQFEANLVRTLHEIQNDIKDETTKKLHFQTHDAGEYHSSKTKQGIRIQTYQD